MTRAMRYRVQTEALNLPSCCSTAVTSSPQGSSSMTRMANWTPRCGTLPPTKPQRRRGSQIIVVVVADPPQTKRRFGDTLQELETHQSLPTQYSNNAQRSSGGRINEHEPLIRSNIAVLLTGLPA